MDGQSYLDEISAANRPAPKAKTDFMKSKFFVIGMIGVVGLILMLIIGSLLSSGKTSVKEQAITLKVRLDNISEMIDTYQPNVKSSGLRSISASLYSVMTNTSRELSEYMEEAYEIKDGKIPEKIANSEDAYVEDLSNELFEAKINGILDRTYTYKMTYEVSSIITMERRIQDATGSETLKGIMDTSLDSMTNIYDALNSYSETDN